MFQFQYKKNKLNFQQPLLQSSVSRDPSEILTSWFGAQETFFFTIINVENSCAA